MAYNNSTMILTVVFMSLLVGTLGAAPAAKPVPSTAPTTKPTVATTTTTVPTTTTEHPTMVELRSDLVNLTKEVGEARETLSNNSKILTQLSTEFKMMKDDGDSQLLQVGKSIKGTMDKAVSELAGLKLEVKNGMAAHSKLDVKFIEQMNMTGQILGKGFSNLTSPASPSITKLKTEEQKYQQQNHSSSALSNITQITLNVTGGLLDDNITNPNGTVCVGGSGSITPTSSAKVLVICTLLCYLFN